MSSGVLVHKQTQAHTQHTNKENEKETCPPNLKLACRKETCVSKKLFLVISTTAEVLSEFNANCSHHTLDGKDSQLWMPLL